MIQNQHMGVGVRNSDEVMKSEENGMPPVILEAKDIVKRFGAEAVLKGVDLTVEKGDVVAIIGPSGSGKTTLLRTLNFLERADEGTLAFEGEVHDLRTIGRRDVLRIRRRTAFVFQNYNLFLNKTALENVTEPLVVARGVPKKAAVEKGRSLLEKVGLLERAANYPSELSGGQQQRVAIARALAGNPDLIYFDEPTSALDPELTESVLQIIRTLAAEGMTMIVVTHELGFAESIATKAVLLEKGVVVEASDAKAFFNCPKEARTKAFLETFRR